MRFGSLVFILLFAAGAWAQEPLRVPLDETGIADWRFLNPLDPAKLEKRDLEVVNITGNRTFVVTIPYESDEQIGLFLSAHVARTEELSLVNVICSALSASEGDATGCQSKYREQLEALEATKKFHDHILHSEPAVCGMLRVPPAECAAAKQAPADCSRPCGDECRYRQPSQDVPSFDLDCELETLYWRSTCDASREDAAALATRTMAPESIAKEMAEEAKALVLRLFADNPRDARTKCGDACASCKRHQILVWLNGDDSSHSGSPIVGIVDRVAHEKVQEQFAKNRRAAARGALANAAAEHAKSIHTKVAALNEEFEARRRQLERTVRNADDPADVAAARYELRLLEAAARLLSSYGPESSVPFDVPADVRQALRAKSRLHDEQRSNPASYAASVDEYRQYVRSVAPLAAQATLVSDAAIDILDCQVKDGKRSCTASAVIPPNQRAVFTAEVLRHHPESQIRFRVAYFGESEVPPNATGNVLRDGGIETADKGDTRIGFGVDTTSAYDLPGDNFQDHNRHTSGSGNLTFQYSGVKRLDVSATLGFKNGDFGGPEESNQVSVPQYQAKISFEHLSLQTGRMKFAEPSAGIAVSESGEGLRLGVGWGTATYIVRRESDTEDQSADPDDDDSDVLLLQFNPVIKHFRNFVATVLYGAERNDRITEVTADMADHAPLKLTTRTVHVPYNYATAGFDARFGVIGLPNAVLSLAAYHSRRNMREVRALAPRDSICETDPAKPCVEEVYGPVSRDGEGTVGLLTFTLNHNTHRKLTDPPSKAGKAYSTTLWLGAGSGDDPNSTDRDESYLGETAKYANDVIFLNQISRSKPYEKFIGRGLTNKYYAGLQYSDARVSPLAQIAKVLKVKQIESRSTKIALHAYRFREAIEGQRYAGTELDVEFALEAPAKVSWTVGAAFFKPGGAVDRLQPLLDKNPWAITAGVSIALDAN